MRALVFGGTGFLGRHLVDALRARDHAVTLFRRGRSSPDLFPDVEHLAGDRTASLAALAGRTWDVAFDPSGYEPRHVRAAAAAAGAHYVFVSTISVYADPTRPIDEAAAVHALDGTEDDLPLSLESYGRLKVACERAVDSILPGRAQHVRAGLILGPHDYDGRFRWWLSRIARGGEVLAPGDPEAAVQAIDARDLASWMVACAERRVTGVFNATGPATRLTMRELLETLRAATRGDARFTWVPDEVLLAHDVGAASEMPFWLPARFAPAFHVDVSRAVAAGLAFRPLAETAHDTWAWLQGRGWDEEAAVREHRTLQVPAGLSPEREATLLAAAAKLVGPFNQFG